MPSVEETGRGTGRFFHPRAAALLFTLASASCEAVFGGFATDNSENCVRNAALCQGPDQICNSSTRQCEPVLVLAAVDPPGGSNLGGTTLTITGQNFVDGMIVTVDGVPASAVTVTAPGQLTAVTPPRPGKQGLVPIALTNPTGQKVQQNTLFRYYSEVTFQQNCFQGPFGVHWILATDLNRDGKTDLVMTGSSLIRTYLSTGDGQTFGSPFDLNTIETASRIAVGDVNADGKPDVLFPSYFPSTSVAVALGNGDGTLQALRKSPTVNSAVGLAVADINGDKRVDVCTLQNKDLVVQLGNGDGTFQTQQNYPFANNPLASASLTLVDLDGDGLLDAVPVSLADHSVSILYGQAGGWSMPMTQLLTGGPTLALVSDYNQDGKLDLALGIMAPGAKVELLPGLGNRNFGTLPALTLSQNGAMAAQGDFNGDGLADLVTLDFNKSSNNLLVYLGTGQGHFAALAPLSIPTSPSSAAVGDWDGDGRQDLVTVSAMGDSICVLRTMAP